MSVRETFGYYLVTFPCRISQLTYISFSIRNLHVPACPAIRVVTSRLATIFYYTCVICLVGTTRAIHRQLSRQQGRQSIAAIRNHSHSGDPRHRPPIAFRKHAVPPYPTKEGHILNRLFAGQTLSLYIGVGQPRSKFIAVLLPVQRFHSRCPPARWKRTDTLVGTARLNIRMELCAISARPLIIDWTI